MLLSATREPEPRNVADLRSSVKIALHINTSSIPITQYLCKVQTGHQWEGEYTSGSEHVVAPVTNASCQKPPSSLLTERSLAPKGL